MKIQGNEYLKKPTESEKTTCQARGYNLSDDFLGGGAAGRVFLATPTKDQVARNPRIGLISRESKVAIKIIYLDLGAQLLGRSAKLVPKEISLLDCFFGSPNVTWLIDVFVMHKRVFLVMEYMKLGNLKQLLYKLKERKEKYLDEEKSCAMFRNIVEGVHYLHGLGIAHRDLKPENILISGDFNVKIADFGLATEVTDPVTLDEVMRETFCGTPSCMAPEIALRKKYDALCADRWSLGVILYVMVHGVYPFPCKTYDELVKHFLSGAELKFREGLSDECKDLLSKLLNFSPTKRLDTQSILDHPWMAQSVKKPSPTISQKALEKAKQYPALKARKAYVESYIVQRAGILNKMLLEVQYSHQVPKPFLSEFGMAIAVDKIDKGDLCVEVWRLAGAPKKEFDYSALAAANYPKYVDPNYGMDLSCEFVNGRDCMATLHVGSINRVIYKIHLLDEWAKIRHGVVQPKTVAEEWVLVCNTVYLQSNIRSLMSGSGGKITEPDPLEVAYCTPSPMVKPSLCPEIDQKKDGQEAIESKISKEPTTTSANEKQLGVEKAEKPPKKKKFWQMTKEEKLEEQRRTLPRCARYTPRGVVKEEKKKPSPELKQMKKFATAEEKESERRRTLPKCAFYTPKESKQESDKESENDKAVPPKMAIKAPKRPYSSSKLATPPTIPVRHLAKKRTPKPKLAFGYRAPVKVEKKKLPNPGPAAATKKVANHENVSLPEESKTKPSGDNDEPININSPILGQVQPKYDDPVEGKPISKMEDELKNILQIKKPNNELVKMAELAPPVIKSIRPKDVPSKQLLEARSETRMIKGSFDRPTFLPRSKKPISINMIKQINTAIIGNKNLSEKAKIDLIAEVNMTTKEDMAESDPVCKKDNLEFGFQVSEIYYSLKDSVSCPVIFTFPLKPKTQNTNSSQKENISIWEEKRKTATPKIERLSPEAVQNNIPDPAILFMSPPMKEEKEPQVVLGSKSPPSNDLLNFPPLLPRPPQAWIDDLSSAMEKKEKHVDKKPSNLNTPAQEKAPTPKNVSDNSDLLKESVSSKVPVSKEQPVKELGGNYNMDFPPLLPCPPQAWINDLSLALEEKEKAHFGSTKQNAGKEPEILKTSTPEVAQAPKNVSEDNNSLKQSDSSDVPVFRDQSVIKIDGKPSLDNVNKCLLQKTQPKKAEPDDVLSSATTQKLPKSEKQTTEEVASIVKKSVPKLAKQSEKPSNNDGVPTFKKRPLSKKGCNSSKNNTKNYPPAKFLPKESKANKELTVNLSVTSTDSQQSDELTAKTKTANQSQQPVAAKKSKKSRKRRKKSGQQNNKPNDKVVAEVSNAAVASVLASNSTEQLKEVEDCTKPTSPNPFYLRLCSKKRGLERVKNEISYNMNTHWGFNGRNSVSSSGYLNNMESGKPHTITEDAKCKTKFQNDIDFLVAQLTQCTDEQILDLKNTLDESPSPFLKENIKSINPSSQNVLQIKHDSLMNDDKPNLTATAAFSPDKSKEVPTKKNKQTSPSDKVESKENTSRFVNKKFTESTIKQFDEKELKEYNDFRQANRVRNMYVSAGVQRTNVKHQNNITCELLVSSSNEPDYITTEESIEDTTPISDISDIVEPSIDQGRNVSIQDQTEKFPLINETNANDTSPLCLCTSSTSSESIIEEIIESASDGSMEKHAKLNLETEEKNNVDTAEPHIKQVAISGPSIKPSVTRNESFQFPIPSKEKRSTEETPFVYEFASSSEDENSYSDVDSKTTSIYNESDAEREINYAAVAPLIAAPIHDDMQIEDKTQTVNVQTDAVFQNLSTSSSDNLSFDCEIHNNSEQKTQPKDGLKSLDENNSQPITNSNLKRHKPFPFIPLNKERSVIKVSFTLVDQIRYIESNPISQKMKDEANKRALELDKYPKDLLSLEQKEQGDDSKPATLEHSLEMEATNNKVEKRDGIHDQMQLDEAKLASTADSLVSKAITETTLKTNTSLSDLTPLVVSSEPISKDNNEPNLSLETEENKSQIKTTANQAQATRLRASTILNDIPELTKDPVDSDSDDDSEITCLLFPMKLKSTKDYKRFENLTSEEVSQLPDDEGSRYLDYKNMKILQKKEEREQKRKAEYKAKLAIESRLYALKSLDILAEVGWPNSNQLFDSETPSSVETPSFNEPRDQEKSSNNNEIIKKEQVNNIATKPQLLTPKLSTGSEHKSSKPAPIKKITAPKEVVEPIAHSILDSALETIFLQPPDKAKISKIVIPANDDKNMHEDLNNELENNGPDGTPPSSEKVNGDKPTGAESCQDDLCKDDSMFNNFSQTISNEIGDPIAIEEELLLPLPRNPPRQTTNPIQFTDLLPTAFDSAIDKRNEWMAIAAAAIYNALAIGRPEETMQEILTPTKLNNTTFSSRSNNIGSESSAKKSSSPRITPDLPQDVKNFHSSSQDFKLDQGHRLASSQKKTNDSRLKEENSSKESVSSELSGSRQDFATESAQQAKTTPAKSFICNLSRQVTKSNECKKKGQPPLNHPQTSNNSVPRNEMTESNHRYEMEMNELKIREFQCKIEMVQSQNKMHEIDLKRKEVQAKYEKQKRSDAKSCGFNKQEISQQHDEVNLNNPLDKRSNGKEKRSNLTPRVKRRKTRASKCSS